ncbi:putative pyrroloquinoline-quinone binding quinoprotein [Kribbella amoyensis]|uniref:Putative pyrroloquinoline-quinone binding quinoprotein n=1 Tax=Kribbella amoyensis TaxID=996641 RepID=A0A561B2X1_9ACTN|nr:PQQ-binding-like beta-propeller repeat protein [Kribbella amoyensis]TWD73210.1 putative pyrroloquinoline-quinone binding quinoprotein [Kribbella amoyensis]
MRRIGVALLTVTALLVGGSTAAAVEDDVIQDLGAPLTSLTVMEGAFGHENGRDVVYAVPAGEDAQLNVVDVRTRELVRAVPLPGAAGAWGITVASDGSVYVGSYSNARLYRYHPDTGTVTDLGQPIAGESFVYGLSAGPNGVVYGGTYPNAHAFRYDPATGDVTDYGSLDTVQQYARSTTYDPDRNALFVGLATPKAKLFRIDLATGDKQELTPASLAGKEISDLDYADGRVFANVSGRLTVFDAATGQQVTFTDAATGSQVTDYPIGARGVSPGEGGAVYFTNATVLTRYDVATDTVGAVTPAVKVTRGAAIGYGWVTENGSRVLYGLGGNYSGGTFRYDPGSGAFAQWSSPFQYVPVPLMHAIADPSNGKVLVNAFLNGSTGTYDPATGVTAPATRQGQVEGWAWGDDGKLYVGIYPYGRLSVWDPHVPESATNPRILFSLVDSHLQNRPVSVVPSDGKVYVGTTPGYGEYGGALTVYDLANGALSVYRNIVVDQTVAAIQPTTSGLWAGSSVDSGQGTEPRATEAVLFRADPATGAKTAELVPVPGAKSINELTVGPDGRLWGLADGTVFVVDPATGTVQRRIKVFDGTTGAADGALSWRDGYLYGVTGGRLFVVDSLAGSVEVLRDRGLNRLTATPDGTYYSLLRPDGKTNPTNLASYVPPADACPGSDLRATVWTGDVDSRVANRFARPGCTVIDELPDPAAKWRDHGTYVRAVVAVTDRLVADDVLSPAEGEAVRSAAARSTIGR